MRLPSRAAATRSSRSTRHCTRAAYAPPEVEPRLGVVGRALGPVLGRADRAIDGGAELVVQRAVEGIEQDAPPQRRRGEHVAGLGRRRAAGAAQLGVDLVEACVEDEVVGSRERVFAADEGRPIGRRGGAGGPGPRADGRGAEGRREGAARVTVVATAIAQAAASSQRAPRPGDHVTLVRSCCFSACRSSASAIEAIEQRAVLDAADAAQSFEYMLIVVKPGMVFTSLT